MYNDLNFVLKKMGKILRSRKGAILIVLFTLFILIIGLGCYSVYTFFQKEDKVEEGKSEEDNVETEGQDKAVEPEICEERKLFFIREDLENEIWTSDWDGSDQKGLGIDRVHYIANGFCDRWLFYAKGATSRIFVYDLLNEETEEIDIYEDEDIKGVVYGGNYPFIISDDGKIAIYGLYYRKTSCEPGAEACPLLPEDIPSTAPKEGYYAYHADTGETIFLADWDSGLNLIFYNWDKDSRYLFSRMYLDEERMDKFLYYKFDVYDGEKTLMMEEEVDEEPYFYFVEDVILKLGYPTYNSLVVKKDGEEKIIEAKSSDIVQRRAWISPDRKNVIYVKDQGLAEDRRALNHRFVLNLDTLETKRILEARDLYTFGHENIWLDNDYFVTEVLKSSGSNPVTDLILVNVGTGEVKEITNSGDIALRKSNIVPGEAP